jgi:hypothetical protein
LAEEGRNPATTARKAIDSVAADATFGLTSAPSALRIQCSIRLLRDLPRSVLIGWIRVNFFNIILPTMPQIRIDLRQVTL